MKSITLFLGVLAALAATLVPIEACQDLTSVNGRAVCSSCCNTWKSAGKCSDGSTVLGGASVKDVVCKSTCGACSTNGGGSTCQDLTSVNGRAVCASCCKSWKGQGKCTDGSTVLGGSSVKDTVCRNTCGTCSSGNIGCPTGWSQAVGTVYDSWPKRGTVECIQYSGCYWAGMFSQVDSGPKNGPCKTGAVWMDGGNGSMACRWPEPTVLSWNMAATWERDNSLLGKKLEVMVQGAPAVTTTVQVLDTCADKDCKDCCSKNTGNMKYKLIDLEKGAASRLLGFDYKSPTFDVNHLPYPKAKGMRPGAPEDYVMPLCYRVLGTAPCCPPQALA